MGVGEDHTASSQDHREARLREQIDRTVEICRIAGATTDADRRRDRGLEVAIKVVARDVELRWAHLEHRAVEAARRDLGHAPRVVHVTLVFGDLREDR